MSNVEYQIIELSSGKTVKVPVLDEKAITIGLRRKTRRLRGDELNEEFLWLVFEEHLTEEELEVIDSLTYDDLEELNNKMNPENEEDETSKLPKG